MERIAPHLVPVRSAAGMERPMPKVSPTALALAAALAALLALPYIPDADATVGGAQARGDTRAEAPQGYRTCFMRRQAVFEGTPRLQSVPSCVFAR